MSESVSASGALPPTQEPLRVAARRMRWFRAALHAYLQQLGDDLGCEFDIDDKKLASIFVRWLRAVDAEKPSNPALRRAYFEFAAGLMLRELTADMPIQARSAPAKAPPQSAAAFWPEGYGCTMFCLAVTSAAIAQEFDQEMAIAPAMDDLRHWWSFRENVVEDSNFSLGFFEMLLGREPNWSMPVNFSARLRRELEGTKDLPRLAS